MRSHILPPGEMKSLAVVCLCLRLHVRQRPRSPCQDAQPHAARSVPNRSPHSSSNLRYQIRRRWTASKQGSAQTFAMDLVRDSVGLSERPLQDLEVTFPKHEIERKPTRRVSTPCRRMEVDSFLARLRNSRTNARGRQRTKPVWKDGLSRGACFRISLRSISGGHRPRTEWAKSCPTCTPEKGATILPGRVKSGDVLPKTGCLHYPRNRNHVLQPRDCLFR